MAATLSREVTGRLRACLFVLAAFITEGSKVAESLLSVQRPHLGEGADPAPVNTVLTGFYQTLRASVEEMTLADDCGVSMSTEI